MACSVVIYRSAERELKALPSEVVSWLASRLQALAGDPRPVQAIRSKASVYYRIRVGDYRVIYAIDDKLRQVTILVIGHRREIYRDI